MTQPPQKKPKIRNTSWKDGGFSGYLFENETPANKMAYLFGGDDGEEAARKIMEEAERQEKQARRLSANADEEYIKKCKQQYIELALQQRSQEVDKGLQTGGKKLFDEIKHLDKPAKGEEAGKEAAVNLLKSLGLNVHPDNVQTNFNPGPPRLFQITWVNRPTENLKNEQSNINKLADMYAGCLPPQEKAAFDNNWQTHTQDALNGGPKIEKSEFLKQADASFEKSYAEFKNSRREIAAEEEHDQEQTFSPSF